MTYSIKVGRRILCGAGLDDLLHDVGNIRAVGTELASLAPAAPQSHDKRFLPLVTGYIPYRSGLLWFQAEFQSQTGNWFRQECGISLSDIPFFDEDLRGFFNAIRETPSSYHAVVYPECFTIRGHIKLRRARQVNGIQADDDFLYVEADNPFFGRAEYLERLANKRIHKSMLDEFCSIPRMMFQVAGGRVQSDETFYLNVITVMHKSLREEILFINAMAWAR